MARQTPQRAEVLEALQEAEVPLSAQELFADLRGAGSRVALATVYRTLNALADEEVADRLPRPSGEVAFRLCHAGHHHHLTCRECGRVREVRDCGLDEWARRVAGAQGYDAVEHAVELIGRCPDCAGRGS